MKLRQARKLANSWHGLGYTPCLVAKRRKHRTWTDAAQRLARSVRRYLKRLPDSYPAQATRDRILSGRALTLAEVS